MSSFSVLIIEFSTLLFCQESPACFRCPLPWKLWSRRSEPRLKKRVCLNDYHLLASSLSTMAVMINACLSLYRPYFADTSTNSSLRDCSCWCLCVLCTILVSPILENSSTPFAFRFNFCRDLHVFFMTWLGALYSNACSESENLSFLALFDRKRRFLVGSLFRSRVFTVVDNFALQPSLLVKVSKVDLLSWTVSLGLLLSKQSSIRCKLLLHIFWISNSPTLLLKAVSI